MVSNTSNMLISSSAIDYQLLDTGNQRKLERFGEVILDRPEVEAKWNTSLSKKEWEKADWYFFEEVGKKGKWINKSSAPQDWLIGYNYKGIKLTFRLNITAFKHVGIFPEQAENWNYIQDCLAQIKGEKKVLNLFAYTGAASIVAAASGAVVTNVDSVKQVLNWGRENAEQNKIDHIRWILEDARKFVEKSLRRKDVYNGIIMDPPAFGFGTKNEKWKLEKDLNHLLEQSIQLLSKNQNFFILNTYSPKLSMGQLQVMLKNLKHFPTEHEARILGLATPQKKVLGLGNLIRFRNQSFA